ncbi:hypothetical protein M8C21_026542 [Ambrosia artemisiifolia]|uniref:CCT domain-containing protein n=1 Tax=Ambrosia artemisiifolia TaxID=4212 RepID=A0AAD5CF02_AMBAR|nr:hypothetical protein M8C21_026542 [Ambrosia artemisiifolia]
MASCLSGAYGFDLENIVKVSSSTTTSSRNSSSSSPSSTLSESSNSPIAVSTRKPRTPRKRPNQTYNEAAALLSTACPAIFSITKKNNSKQSKLPNQHTYFFNEPTELLLPFPSEKAVKMNPRGVEYNGRWNYSPNSNSMELSEGYEDDFDAESMLDEEIEEGIDSIMGNLNTIPRNDQISNEKACFSLNFGLSYNTCYGYPMGLGLGGNLELNFGFGLRNGVRAIRKVDEGYWSVPAVNVMNISSPSSIKSKKSSPIEKKKKVEELMKLAPELRSPIVGEENLNLENGPRLLLKLNYDKVLEAWSDKGSPLLEKVSSLESTGRVTHTRSTQVDLFSENEEARDACVTRSKEKRRTWLFSKKIKYQVKKVNADRRPRSKGKFVRRPDSPTCEET